VFENSRIPNSQRGREGLSGVRKILRKKNSLFLKKIQALQRVHLQSNVSL
jgi:hypothetical protein